MKKFYLFSILFCISSISNAQFQSRKDVISYLCSKPFYDSEKEYKVIFKAEDVEFAGNISKQLQVFVNGNLKGIISQSEVRVNPYTEAIGVIDGGGLKGIYADVWFKEGRLACFRFFNLPIDALFIEGSNDFGKVQENRGIGQSQTFVNVKPINISSVIGKPIKIGNLFVAQYDFPEAMSWSDAKAACTKLGKGWRLPTKNELNTLYINQKKIGGFWGIYYCSSTESSDGYGWVQTFDNGYQYFGSNETSRFNVRAVRESDNELNEW